MNKMRQALYKSRHALTVCCNLKGNARIQHPATWDLTRRARELLRETRILISTFSVFSPTHIKKNLKSLVCRHKDPRHIIHHHHRYERGRETKVLPTDDDDGERRSGKRTRNKTTARRRVSLLRQVHVLRGIVSERHQEEKSREIFKYGGKR